jgi:hypothetical protein
MAGLGNAMRVFHVIFVCATLCGLAGCSAAPKIDFTPVTNSPLPSMQQYDRYIGYDFWLNASVLRLCEKPISTACGYGFLTPATHLKVDGLVPNHTEGVTGISIDEPYLHVVLDDGRSGFVDARNWSIMTTTVDPAVAGVECKKKGDPKLGMNAKQVAATCWGPPQYVNTKIRKTGKFEQFVYGDNKFVYLHNDVVTSVSVKDRRPDANEFAR